MKNKNYTERTLLKVLCLVLIVCFTVGCLPMMASEDDTKKDTQIVVAARDIPKGSWISESYLKMVSLGDAKMPANAITDMSSVTGKYASMNIIEGEYLYEDQLSATKVNKIDDDLLNRDIISSTDPYVVVTDYISPNAKKDVHGILQMLIDKNPRRTIYFPDGEYLISAPLIMPGKAVESVSLRFSDGAVLKATDNFKRGNGISALIGTGTLSNESNIKTYGSYYSIVGGIFDGNGRADEAIHITYSRECLIRGMLIKNVKSGIYVDRGVVTYSADVDIEDVTIIGKGAAGSKGIKIIGTDSTYTNIRIYDMEIGIDNDGAGSLFKNIYIYNTLTTNMNYQYTVGIRAMKNLNDNWYSQCYVENYLTAYELSGRSIFFDCSAKWTSEQCAVQTFVAVDEPIIGIGGCKAYFYGSSTQTTFLKTRDTVANKIIEGCIFDESACSDKKYQNYTDTNIIPTS